MACATASNRQQILEAFLARLERITQTHEFQTDAGKAVFLGATPTLGPDDPDTAIAIVVREDQPGYQGENVFILLPIDIQALAKADLDNPYLAVEAILADIKRAVELPDRTLGELVKRQIRRATTRTLERQDGSTVVGVAITYACPYTEVWGNP